MLPKPITRPVRPYFSSGPCAKRPGWSLAALEAALVGRSHRAPAAKARLSAVIDRSRSVLGIPADWRVGIVPASDSGAVELALWSLLGPRPVDVLAFEGFSAAWGEDVVGQLRLPNTRILAAPYGALPDLGLVLPDHDVVFAWNGTTSGVCIPNAAWLVPGRAGLAICDATSAAFAMALPWERLDVVTWSWQKILGGEAAHGMIALSRRAVERLQTYQPPWPIPKIFRISDKGNLYEGIFRGDTINTPSLLCVEDALDGLVWAEAIGGLPSLIARSQANLAAVAAWVAETPYVEFLARAHEARSSTAICLTFQDAGRARQVQALLEGEAVAFDIAPYRDAPPGLRIWGGATVDTCDIKALLPWIDWAYQSLGA
ncbi:MAG: phosphoserine transaminase [Acidocella sp.]|nr:phosphoserine transaminase [Acidocella sp.]